VTNDLMVGAARLARQYEGVRLHTHLAENQEDVDFSLKVYGCRPGQYIKCAPQPICFCSARFPPVPECPTCMHGCRSYKNVPSLHCT
jgi:hypothetical protein